MNLVDKAKFILNNPQGRSTTAVLETLAYNHTQLTSAQYTHSSNTRKIILSLATNTCLGVKCYSLPQNILLQRAEAPVIVIITIESQ